MSQKDFIFDGFEQANTTPVPDVFFDELLSKLSGAEVKVLLYIIRRTAGFKKTSDAISLSQFEYGIIKGDGTVLDLGCGLSRETICKALDSLEKRGCIKSVKREGENGEKDTTVYSVRFKGEVVGKSDQVVGKIDYQKGSRKIRPGSRIRRKEVVGKSDLQETVLQQTEGTKESDPVATIEQDDSLILSSIPSVSLGLSTSAVDNPASDEILVPPVSPIATVTTGNDASNTSSLSSEELRIQGYWCQLGKLERPSARAHWATLSRHLKSFEDMKSLYTYAKARIRDDPAFKSKMVNPGNLANAVILDGWMQEREPEPEMPSKPKGKITAGNRHLQPFSSMSIR